MPTPPPRKRPFPWKTLRSTAVALAFTAVVVVLLLWLAGTFRPKIDAHQPPPVAQGEPIGNRQLVAVREIPVPNIESAPGTVRAVQQTTIAAEVMAKILEVNVQAGQHVKKGDVLIRLDPEELKARLQQAEGAVAAATATRDQAKTELERVQALSEKQTAAKLEVQRAETAFREADAELEQAQQARHAAAKNLSYTAILSPFDGVVIDKQVSAGDTAYPQKTLLTLYDPTHMQLVASVRESLIKRVQKGQKLPVRIDALRLQCEGVVTEIVPESQTASRSFQVKVSGPCPPDIHTGMFGRLLIPMDPERWWAIPRAAIHHVGQLEIVYVADPDRHTLHRRTIRTGRTHLDEESKIEYVEILSGLQPGEQVALPANAASERPA